jgi:hypothetical protein
MRIIFGLTLLIVALAADTASAEITYPWCKSSSDGGTNCGFSTLEQCQGGSPGSSAFCSSNPRYQGPPAASPEPNGAAVTGKRRSKR